MYNPYSHTHTHTHTRTHTPTYTHIHTPTHPHPHTHAHTHIPPPHAVSLAIADVIFLLVCVNYEVGMKISPGNWLLGSGMCRFARFVEMLSATSSILNLTAVSIERSDFIRCKYCPIQREGKITMQLYINIITGYS